MKTIVRLMARRSSIQRYAFSCGWLALVSSCASTGTPRPGPYQVGASTAAPPVLSPPPAATALEAPKGTDGGPPTLAPSQPTMVGMPSARINVVAKGDDLGDVLTTIARQVGLRATIDPVVRGPVTRTLRDVSLHDAMQNLLGGQYQYQVNNGTLVVSAVSLIQRTYTMDYLMMSRVTTASTVVSRGTAGASNSQVVAGATGAGTGVSSTAGGLVASGSDVIQSSSNADVWGELTGQLESILFGSGSDSSGTVGSPVLTGGRSYNRCVAGTCLRISPLSSLIDVTATPEKHEQVERYIALYRAAVYRQVSIKAQVVEVSLDRTHTLGIDWAAILNGVQASVSTGLNQETLPLDPKTAITSLGGSTFNLHFGDFTLRAVLNALKSVGDVNVVATPQTNALNQQRASFNVTRQQQFFIVNNTPIFNSLGVQTGVNSSTSIQVATVGLVFDVLPQISADNMVMMTIRPSVTSLVSSTPVKVNGVEQGSLPILDHRETDTMARVHSGETIMIGGLIQKQATNARSGIPILMDLPVFGRLFGKTTTTEKTSELVIFLTPEIVSGQPPTGR